MEVDIELEALWSSTTWVWDLMLERADRTSSLVVSLSSLAELLEDHIDVVAANWVRWDTQTVLVATPGVRDRAGAARTRAQC
jgi:hypothetical protein